MEQQRHRRKLIAVIGGSPRGGVECRSRLIRPIGEREAQRTDHARPVEHRELGCLLKLDRGVEFFAAALSGLGIPAAEFMAWITIVIEILGGLAVLAGAYIRLVSVPMTIVLLVAIFKVHWQFGFSSIKFLSASAAGLQFGKPGVECDLLYLACLATLLAGGTGLLAFDSWRRSASAKLRAREAMHGYR